MIPRASIAGGGHTLSVRLAAGLAILPYVWSAATNALPAADISPPPCAACLAVSISAEHAQAIAAAADLPGLRVLVRPGAGSAAAANALRRRGIDVGFDVEEADLPAFLAQQDLDASTVVLRPAGEDLTAERIFALRKSLAEIRGRLPSAAIGIAVSATPARLHQPLVPYLDFIAVGGDLTATTAEVFGSLPVWRSLSMQLPAPLAGLFTLSGTSPTTLLRLEGPPDEVAPFARRVWELGEWLPAGLSALAEVAVVGCSSGPADPAASGAATSAPLPCSARAFLHPQALDAVLLFEPVTAVQSVTVKPAVKAASAYDLSDSREAVMQTQISAGADATVISFRKPIARPFLVRLAGWRQDTADAFAEEVRVTARRNLTAGEILARHQAAVAGQRRLVTGLIASGNSVVTLEVPGFAAPVSITAATTLFSSRAVTEMEQRDIRVNGVAFEPSPSGVPRLPIIEPERVAAAPLDIALNEMYEYALVGVDEAAGRPCYSIAFAPRRADRSLFAGRACIDGETFGLARVTATQTALRGPIVSSEQHDTFVPMKVPGAPDSPRNIAWLLSRSEVHQVYEGAGYRTPIHRVLSFGRHEINPESFAARRAAAHAGRAVILRETAEGYRYLIRRGAGSTEGAGSAGGAEGAKGVEGAGERVLAPGGGSRARRVRTLVGGVIVDPNINVPLPFAGLSYLDFDLFHTGAQFNGFFGGAYGQLAWSIPSVARTRWQIGGTAFATVAEYNDRAFRDGIERYAENLRQRPANVAVWALRPLGPRLWLRAAYEIDYKHLRAGDTTARDFVTPVSPLVHGLRLSVEAQRGPWRASTWWNPGVRQRWRPWGSSAEDVDDTRDFQRFGATLTRSLVVSPALVGRVEATATDGRDLDRFSRYTFGTFENRLRGYPGASIRYDAGLIGRAAMSWTAFPGVRIDWFVDSALVRDPGLSRRATGHTGVGGGVELPLPFDTLMAAEFGYGVQARNEDGSRGTKTFQVTLFKVF